MNLFTSETESPRWEGKTECIKFPSDRHVSIDWHKLASIDLHDLLKGQCSVSTLQDHLNHIAFCQAHKEIRIETTAGQRNMVKLFRLSQLMIQYLFLSQEVIETKMNQAIENHKTTLDKYNEAKHKLSKQIEEVKKLKRSNKHFSENIAYLQTLLASVGAIEYFRCPICSKAFRGKEFLCSHIQRKHPSKLQKIDLKECLVYSPNTSDESINEVKESSNRPKTSSSRYGNQLNYTGNLSPVKTTILLHTEPPTRDNLLKDASTANASKDRSMSLTDMPNNDNDAQKMKEMENNLIDMKTLVLKLSKDVEYQNQQIENEKKKRKTELDKLENEKKLLRKDYEKTLNELSDKIIFLQTEKNGENGEEQNISEIIAIQRTEIDNLKTKLSTRNVNKTKEKDKVEGLIKEINKLKHNVLLSEKEQKEKIRLLEIALQKKYEQNLQKEKNNFHKQIETLKSNSIQTTQNTSTKPIPVPMKRTLPISNLKTKPPLDINFPNQDEHEIDLPQTEPNASFESHSKSSKMIPLPKDKMIPSDSESESIETETSKWYGEKEAVEEETESDVSIPLQNLKSYDEDCHSFSSSEDSRTSGAPNEINNLERHPWDETNEELESHQRSNPTTWNQMKESIESELEKRFKETFGIHNSQKMNNKIFQSCLQKLLAQRNNKSNRNKDLLLIRKSIENQLENQIQSKSYEQTTDFCTVKKKYSFFKNSFKKIHKSVSNKKRAIAISLKPASPHIWVDNNPELLAVTKNNKPSQIQAYDTEEIVDTDSNSNSFGPEQHTVDIHIETSQSIERNLFQSSPVLTVPEVSKMRPTLYENYPNPIKENDPDIWSSSSEEDGEEHTSDKAAEEAIEAKTDHWTLYPKDNEIVLKKPSGENIKKLSRVIEQQLYERRNKKLAGAVDVMGES